MLLLLNAGESGLVYRGYINSGELVAVKTGKGKGSLPHKNILTEICFTALSSATKKDRLLQEVSNMLSFHHPNVMPLIGMCFDGEVPLLIMPFMSGGSVLDYVSHNRDNLLFDKGSQEEQVVQSMINFLTFQCLEYYQLMPMPNTQDVQAYFPYKHVAHGTLNIL